MMNKEHTVIGNARFAHVDVVARDWRRLARFYQEVFGCEILPPERDLQGEWLSKGTGIPGAHITGAHLRLPGLGADGPTLEIFQYDDEVEPLPPAVNRPGWGHIALAVPDVDAAREAVLAAGGSDLGEVVSLPVPGAGVCTFVYMADPEGNAIELQSWQHEEA
jgi:predicted enzyme related to lactoylglutathione lyase